MRSSEQSRANAKCKMQNAKGKVPEAEPGPFTARRWLSVPISPFAFCILHFAFAPQRSRSSRRPASRAAFSLLEVILALTILVGAIVVLGELVRLGTMTAAGARDLTQAQLLCESKMSEI